MGRQSKPGARAFRRASAAVAASLIFLMPVSGGASAPADGTASLPVERQNYAYDGPTDPYSLPSADPTTIHVGVQAGSEVSRSYLRLALDRLPPRAEVGKVVLTLHVTQKAESSKNTVFETYNVNPSQWLLQACVLTSELREPFDGAAAPGYDCQHGSAVGVPVEGTDAWTFNLSALVKVWAVAGNTGAAIIPIPTGEASNTWSVSFFKARSESEVAYRVPPLPPAKNPKPPAGGPKFFPIPKTVAPTYPLPTAEPVPSQAPVAQPPSGPVVASKPVSIPGPRQPWGWVLAGCLGAAVLVLALARRPKFAVPGWEIPQVFADIKSHPRAYSIASVTAIWGLLFATYSIVVAPPTLTALRHDPNPGVDAPLGNGGDPANPGLGGGAPGPGGRFPGRPGQPTLPGGGSTPGPGGGPSVSGTYRQLGNMNVFFPSDGSTPIAQLFSEIDDTIGIDYRNKRIKLCGHAAMTYGPAFNIEEKDLKIYWDWLNSRGGIDGWQFDFDLVDDGYDPGKAVQAAQVCKDSGAFMILGGIGFDQIPAVRYWAEQNKQLYMHHVVTEAGSRGSRYSFTALVSEERMGEMFGQLAVHKFRGKRVGIIWRDSPNWQSGHDLFKKVVRACKCIELRDEWDLKVNKDQGNYTSEVARLNGQVDAVFVWENALATVEVIKQAQGQQFFPDYLVFPFNLELQSLKENDSAFRQPIYGVAAWDAYTHGYYEGLYSEYRNEIDTFERAYRQLDPGANLAGPGGDLLFLAWEGFDALADVFRSCLPNCTRNKLTGALLTYDKKVGGYCPADFTRGDNHHGGWTVNVLEVVRAPNGTDAYWKPTMRCVERI